MPTANVTPPPAPPIGPPVTGPSAVSATQDPELPQPQPRPRVQTQAPAPSVSPYQEEQQPVITVAQTEEPVPETPVSAQGSTVIVSRPQYLIVTANGEVVVNAATTMNFVGNGVTVTASGSTANVQITGGGGGSSYGNSNVATLLANFGSNVISTTGSITGGTVSGNIVAPDGNGSVILNSSGFLGAASGLNYDFSANMLFTPGITVDGSANTGIGAIYGGIGGYTVLGSDVVMQLTSNLNAYTQINAQNINPGSFASSDYIITADNGTDSTYYLDLGLAGSGHQDPDFFGDIGSANDGYLYVTATDQAGPSNGAGNLLVGSTNGVIKLFVGNTAQANVIATVTSNGISINGAITSNSTIDIDNRASGNAADIRLYSADDIVLQARDRTLGSTSEGGDISIYAGDSAEDGDSSGGDVQIFAGDGGAANVDFGGSGGFITIRSGQGGSAIGDGVSSAMSGGSLTLEAGDAGGNNGNIDRGAAGGDVFITAGDSTGNLDAGGDIILTTGTAGSNALAGNVQITIPSSDLGSGGTWTFRATGNLTLPRGGVVYETNIPFGGLDGNTIALAPSGGIDADQQLLVYPTAGPDANHLHLTSGNLYNTELFVGDDNLYVKLANTGNVVINSNDGTGNSAQWTFGTDGNLTLPTQGYLRVQTGIIGAGASPAPTLSGFSSIATTGIQGNISASGNLLASGYANITGNINGSGAAFSGNITANYVFGNGNQLTSVNAATVDITNTNGLTTTYYPTFVENSNTGQIVRADVDMTYRTDINMLTVGNITARVSVTTPVALANLTAVAGARAFCNNANLTAAGNFGSQISGGGSNTVPVWSDGTNWYIG